MTQNIPDLICLFATPDTGDQCNDEEDKEDGGEDDGEGDAGW